MHRGAYAVEADHGLWHELRRHGGYARVAEHLLVVRRLRWGVPRGSGRRTLGSRAYRAPSAQVVAQPSNSSSGGHLPALFHVMQVETEPTTLAESIRGIVDLVSAVGEGRVPGRRLNLVCGGVWWRARPEPASA